MTAPLPTYLSGEKIALLSTPPESFDANIAQLLSNPAAMVYLTAMSLAESGGWTLDDARRRREQQELDQGSRKGWFCAIEVKNVSSFGGICGLRTIDWFNRYSLKC